MIKIAKYISLGVLLLQVILSLRVLNRIVLKTEPSYGKEFYTEFIEQTDEIEELKEVSLRILDSHAWMVEKKLGESKMVLKSLIVMIFLQISGLVMFFLRSKEINHQNKPADSTPTAAP